MARLMTNVTIEFHSKKDYNNFLKRIGTKEKQKAYLVERISDPIYRRREAQFQRAFDSYEKAKAYVMKCAEKEKASLAAEKKLPVAIDTVDRDWAFEKVIWECIDLSVGSPEDYYVPVEWQISHIEIE